MKEFIYTWRIENISYSWHKLGESIFSPTFTAGPIQNSVWALKLYPRGENVPDYFSLYLRRGEDNGPINITINFELTCISAENSPLHSYKFSEADMLFTKSIAFGHPRFMRCYELFLQRKALYLPGDVLTLRCRMWKDEGAVNEFGQSFGSTRLTIERISLVENINPEIAEEKIVCIHSKRQNESLISISILRCEDLIRFIIEPKSVENIKFSVLKLLFVEKSTGNILCEHRSSWLGAPKKETWRLPLVSKALDSGNEDSVEDNLELVSKFVYSTGEESKQIENDDRHSTRLSEITSKYIISCTPLGNQSGLPRISQELWNLYVEHVICDVELKTQTASFFAHKFVFCARSPVLLAMLTDDMKEMRNKCIEIEDIVDDILSKFLFFLYTDTFEDLEWDAVIGLYYASDKYQVERLKILCSCYLMKNINYDNVCELLLLADRHHDSDFKRRVEEFIVRNDLEIFSSPAWKQFGNKQPLLAFQTVILKYDKEREKENSAETYEEKLSRLPNVQDDFTAAYQDGIISDIIIRTTNTKFHAHRSVLGASSSIIREKFAKDMKDKATDVLEIPDLEDDIVSRLLLFLYADSLGDVQWDTAIKLYHAADVYQIQRLKIKCSCFLLENIETSNASELLLLAHEHRDARLKSVVEDYIFLHCEEIFGSDEWADFSETNFRLANETMRFKFRKKYDDSHLPSSF